MDQFCSLPFAIKALENHIKRYMYPHGDEPHHPTEMQQAVIWYLGQRMGQDIFQRDLEKAFHMRRSTATGQRATGIRHNGRGMTCAPGKSSAASAHGT